MSRLELIKMADKFKPVVSMIGKDGNVFNLIAITKRALEHADMKAEAKEMQERVFSSRSYSDALSIMMEYVEVE